MAVFVTVGTTSFDALIATVDSAPFAALLQEKGYSRLVVQYGRGEHEPSFKEHARYGVSCTAYRFTDALGIHAAMGEATLVISHAGAGSILEGLGRGKPLLVVVNDALMGNHQMELAGQLDADGHLHCTGCSELLPTLRNKDFTGLLPMPPPAADAFAAEVDVLMGWAG